MGNYKRSFINLGKYDKFYPEQLIELVNTNTTGKKIPIGKIDLLKNFSFFEVEDSLAYDLIGALNNVEFMDRKVSVEIARENTGKQGQAEYSGIKTTRRSKGRNGKRRTKKRNRAIYKSCGA